MAEATITQKTSRIGTIERLDPQRHQPLFAEDITGASGYIYTASAEPTRQRHARTVRDALTAIEAINARRNHSLSYGPAALGTHTHCYAA